MQNIYINYLTISLVLIYIYSKNLIYNNKVDATKLLSVVEDELETNFRDRVFEALGDGYEKVRTAVVNREY